MKFDSPSSLLTEITQMLQAQSSTMRNRSLINKLMNGEAPMTEDERREQNLKSNVNFLEGTRLASNAKNQVDSTFFKPARYFSVVLDKGPLQKRAAYSASITKYINKELKKSFAYKAARESAHAQVVLHGPGPLIWRNRRTPIPSTAGIDDIIVPSGTLTSMENLDRFAVYREMTWNQLYDQACGPVVDAGWNSRYVVALLAKMFKTGVEPIYQGNRWMFPEKLAEDVKEGAAQSASSSLPKVMAWDFFFRDEDSDKWNRRMIVDFGSIDTETIKDKDPIRQGEHFLYERDDYADDWHQIIHWYIGNCSNVAPFRYYSVRSIGYLLYGVCMIQNKLRNRFSDHMFQQLLTWFRNVSDDSREKLGMIDLQNYGVMPDGVSMVTANERHAADYNLIQIGLQQGRQLMAESVQGFVPEMVGDQDKVMTAQEFIGRMNMSIAMTSAVTSQLAEQSKQEYQEILRRFCIKDNPDPMVKRFRDNLRKVEVPLDMLDMEALEVVPEHTSGGGNKAAELNITQAMMQEFYMLVDPEAQRLIARKRALALTDNADEAFLLFPDAPKPPSDDVQYAQTAYAVLMLGIPFAKKEGINHIAYASMLLTMMQTTLQQVAAAVEQPNGAAIAADKIVGLFNVATHIQEEINIIGRDERQVDKAKQLFKALTELSTLLQNVAKQLMASEESQNAQGGIPPEKLAKIQEIQLMGQVTREEKARAAAEKQQQKDIAFHAESLRRDAAVAEDVRQKRLLTQVEVESIDLKTRAEILRPKPQTAGK